MGEVEGVTSSEKLLPLSDFSPLAASTSLAWNDKKSFKEGSWSNEKLESIFRMSLDVLLKTVRIEERI